MAVAATDRGSTAHMEQRTSPPQGQELANLEEDAINLPLHEERYEPLVAAMDELGAGVWLHPHRAPGTPGSPSDIAPFLLWQVYGWTFDTTITPAWCSRGFTSATRG